MRHTVYGRHPMPWRDAPPVKAPPAPSHVAVADRRRGLIFVAGLAPMSADAARQLAASVLLAVAELEADTTSQRVARALAAMEAEKATT